MRTNHQKGKGLCCCCLLRHRRIGYHDLWAALSIPLCLFRLSAAYYTLSINLLKMFPEEKTFLLTNFNSIIWGTSWENQWKCLHCSEFVCFSQFTPMNDLNNYRPCEGHLEFGNLELSDSLRLFMKHRLLDFILQKITHITSSVKESIFSSSITCKISK